MPVGRPADEKDGVVARAVGGGELDQVGGGGQAVMDEHQRVLGHRPAADALADLAQRCGPDETEGKKMLESRGQEGADVRRNPHRGKLHGLGRHQAQTEYLGQRDAAGDHHEEGSRKSKGEKKRDHVFWAARWPRRTGPKRAAR